MIDGNWKMEKRENEFEMEGRMKEMKDKMGIGIV